MGLHMQVIIALLLGIKRNGHIFIGLLLGVLVGFLFPQEAYPRVYNILNFIATGFIYVIQMVVLPLVMSAIIIGISNIGDSKQLAKLGTKMLLYYAQIHGNQLEYDEKREIVKTMTINILDFIFTKEMNYHSRMILREEKMTNVMSDCLEIHILELPKFKRRLNKEMTLKDAWMSYLKGENIEEAIKKSEKIKKLDDLLKKYWREEIME